MDNIGRILWNLTITILQAMGDVFEWLTTPKSIGKIEILGWEIMDGLTFTPLALSGGFILAILGIGLISLLNPFN